MRLNLNTPEVEYEIDKLFHGSTEGRLKRCLGNLHRAVDRFNHAHSLEGRLERLTGLAKRLCPPPLPPAERRRLVKRFQRPPRPGYVNARKYAAQLDMTPASANIAGVDEEERSCTVVLTTGVVDRVGDIVRPASVDLAAYKRNPIVLLNHQSDTSLPIGTTRDPRTGQCTVRYEPQHDRLVGKIYFARGNERAEEAWQLVKQGILGAVSIGFNPISQPRPLPSGGSEFSAVELLELSLVNVPCNPQALVMADGVGAR